MQLPDETIQEVTARTEGWLVCNSWGFPYQSKLILSPCCRRQTSGDQRYILDYLIKEVLRRQPQDVHLSALYIHSRTAQCLAL